ncbi:MAG: alkylation response protein AidB-like acyl-CoA dehydrogenase, partial [Nitriliruptoraceae bacterium]
DVGALTSKAIPQDDGTYLVSGTKIWISYGDHDLTDNIVHLVLARLPDAPVGTKGISLFVVPKVLVNDDGSLGARNNVEVVSTEHKLGIHASPTCVMEYAEAVGYLIGEPNKGMRQMFTMMNDARLGVGVQGIAISERAYQQALQYSLERRQGIAPGDTELVDGQSLIVKHPDVRRQLLTIKSTIEAARALALRNASALDFAEHHPDADRREAERKLADLLTPLTKSWGTDLGVENTSHAIQIYGGMGYVEETGVAQHFRDARIAPIYEGTNGIQAMDLVGRKLPYDGGAFVKGQLGEIGALAASLTDERFGAFGSQLARANDALGEATEWIFANREDFAASFGGATPYLRMFAVVMAGKLLAEGLVSGAAASDVDAEYLNDRFGVARFYADNILTTVHGLLGPATAGGESLFALADDHLASV